MNQLRTFGSLCTFAVLVLVASMPGGIALADELPRAQVAEPYIELHTGPGRGYPVFHVVAEGDWLDIVKRRTDWFRVHTARGVSGWVNRAQLAQTLDAAGVPRSFRDIVRDDYLARRLEFGFSGGSFGGDPALGARLGLRATDNILFETFLTQVSGNFSSSRAYGANLAIQPYGTSRLSPYFSIGIGNFSNEPKVVLVDAEKTSSELASVALGMRSYVSERFMLRAEFRHHLALVKTEDYEDFDEVLIGVSFFF